MVNTRGDLGKVPPMDNDGKSYIIPLDVYKEGYWAYNISNYFKARVGDNGTKFMVQWHEHGQLKNVLGLRPFLSGKVGQYSVDDSDPENPRVIMAADASTVDITGDTTDVREGGIAVYNMIEQGLPQSCIFYGAIGLRGVGADGRHQETSVDIAFKVLDNNVEMLGAKRFYISELEQALNEFQNKMDQHDKDYQVRLQKTINDANQKIATETAQSEAALNALQSEIRANRAEQGNISTHLAGIEQQIEIHDVVTKPEFEALDGRITERLSKMDLTPHMYINEATMKAQNPNGTPNLCVTADTGHKWIWDYDTNVFVDAGPYNFALLDNGQNYMLSTPNPNNEVPDSDFKATNTDFWFMGANGKPGVFNVDSTHSTSGSNIASITEVGDQGAWIQTHDLPVRNLEKKYSYRLYLNCRRADIPAYVSIIFTKADGTQSWDSTYLKNQNNDEFIKLEKQDISVPSGSVKWRMAIILPKNGTVKIYKPQLVWNDHLVPYQAQKYSVSTDSNNLIDDPDFALSRDYWTAEGNKVIPDFSINSIGGIGRSNIATLTANGNGGSWIRSEDIPVKGKTWLSFVVYANLQNDDQGGYVGFWYLDENHKLLTLKSVKITTSTNNQLKLYKFGAAVTENVDFIRIVFVVNNLGTLRVCRPKVNEGTSYIPYSEKELLDFYYDALTFTNSDNILRNANFALDDAYWNISSNGKMPEWTFNKENGINNSRLVTMTGDEPKGFIFASNNYDLGDHKKISYSAYASASNIVDGDQKPYISIWFLNDQSRIITSDVTNFDNQNLELIKAENITVPNNAVKVRFALVGFNKQTVRMSRPAISLTPRLNDVIPELNDLPQLRIETNGQTVKDSWVKAAFNYQTGTQITRGYIQIALQGDSSRGFIKKNYKIKLYKDKNYKDKLKIRPKASFNKNYKWNLKANWIDATQARNLVNARIFERATNVTPFENEEVAKKLSQGQAMGQMEGFPIEIYLDGNYNGLYTWNTKKDEKFFGMDSNIGEEIIVFETPGSQLKTTSAKFDGTDYSTEVQDKATPELKTNFNKFLKFLNTSSDDDIKAHLKDYIDVHSVINTYLYGILAMVWDTSGKSNLLITYNNGQYFYMLPYDMDSTWGLKPDGLVNKVPLPEYDFANIGKKGIMQFVTEEGQMKIFNVIYKLFKPEMVKQYKLLRQSVWSNSTMIDEFKKFIDAIPQAAYDREQEKWPQIPSLKKGDFEQIQSAIIQRGVAMDKWINTLIPENDPITNLQAQINELKKNGTSK